VSEPAVPAAVPVTAAPVGARIRALWHGWTFYVVRRLLVLVPQLLAVSIVAFFLIRLVPGSPAAALLGPNRTEESVQALERRMGLDQPFFVQYWRYLKGAVQGDLGVSWFSGQAVLDDLADRAPATLELIVYSMIVAIVVGIALGAFSAIRAGGWGERVISWWMRVAGAFPDFWVGLVLIYVFFYILRWAPAPLGRLGVEDLPPRRITGAYTLDSLLTGNWTTLGHAIAHLVLPVCVLGLLVSLIVTKVVHTSVRDVLRSDFIRYARASGLSRRTLHAYTIRNALPPTVTLGGVMFAYLLGGAVLIEQVFSWGGVGQYAIQAVVNTDYGAVQGFLLLAAAFTMVVYLVVDLVHMAIDPRVTHER
jgi:peptide/nickel transport system permease protein